MTDLARRELMAAAVIGLGLAAAAQAEACSLVATRKPEPFSEGECRRSLQLWVDLLNRGPEMSREGIAELVDDRNISIDDEMVMNVLGDRMNSETQRGYVFYKEFRLSGGRPDPRPIKIAGFNLIRQLRNRATYQFTLERYSYHPADEEGCNGLFTHDEFWGVDRASYLATFLNNDLRSVRLFPEWYLEERRS